MNENAFPNENVLLSDEIKGEFINLWIANDCFPYVLGNNVLFDTELFLRVMELTVKKVKEEDERNNSFHIRYSWTYRGEIIFICDSKTAIPNYDLPTLTAFVTVIFNRVLRDEVTSYFAMYTENSDKTQRYTDYQNAINSDLYFVGTADILSLNAIIARMVSEEKVLYNDTYKWLEQTHDKEYINNVEIKKPQVLYGTGFACNYFAHHEEKKFWSSEFEKYLKGSLQ